MERGTSSRLHYFGLRWRFGSASSALAVQQGLRTSLQESAQKSSRTCWMGHGGVRVPFGLLPRFRRGFFKAIAAKKLALRSRTDLACRARATRRTTRIPTNRRAASETQNFRRAPSNFDYASTTNRPCRGGGDLAAVQDGRRFAPGRPRAPGLRGVPGPHKD